MNEQAREAMESGLRKVFLQEPPMAYRDAFCDGWVEACNWMEAQRVQAPKEQEPVMMVCENAGKCDVGEYYEHSRRHSQQKRCNKSTDHKKCKCIPVAQVKPTAHKPAILDAAPEGQGYAPTAYLQWRKGKDGVVALHQKWTTIYAGHDDVWVRVGVE